MWALGYAELTLSSLRCEKEKLEAECGPHESPHRVVSARLPTWYAPTSGERVTNPRDVGPGEEPTAWDGR